MADHDPSDGNSVPNDETRPGVKELRIHRLEDSPDHRTLFSLEEVEAAYRRVLSAADAAEAARETMDASSPVVPGNPSFFTNDLLDLLELVSDDVARRVRLARGGDRSAPGR
jgi:hypothetical protein